MLAQIFKQHELEATSDLYQPETDSRVVRQLVKTRNEFYLDDEISYCHQVNVAKRIDEVLRYIDSVDLELPRYGV